MELNFEYPFTLVWESTRRWGNKKKHFSIIRNVFDLKQVTDMVKSKKGKIVRTEKSH